MVKYIDFQNEVYDVDQLFEYVNLFATGNASNIKIPNYQKLENEMTENLQFMNTSYGIVPLLPPKTGGLLGTIKYFVKKVVFKAVYGFLVSLSQKQTEFNAYVVRYQNSNMKLIQQLLQDNIALEKNIYELKKQISDFSYGLTGGLEDSWYVKFENTFRGTQEAIYERAKKYVPILKGRSNVLELGCGRGELLELLNKEGIHAEGVDINTQMVDLCKQKGLEVRLGDAVSELQHKKNESIDAVVGIQIVEHFTVNQLKQIIDLCFEKLVKGGVIIFETVNPLCLGIFCYGFYIDPTHIKPVHPALLRFMLEECGFIVDSIQFVDEFPEDYLLSVEHIADEATQNAVEKINKLIYGAQDYYILARKPEE